jgi:alkylhydroperoxidase family enzyme
MSSKVSRPSLGCQTPPELHSVCICQCLACSDILKDTPYYDFSARPAAHSMQQMLMHKSSFFGLRDRHKCYLCPQSMDACRFYALIKILCNLPGSLLTLRDTSRLQGLVLFYSAAAARCSYCLVHATCFALRRGMPERFLRPVAAVKDLPARERMAARIGVALSRLPGKVPDDLRDAVLEEMDPSEGELMVMSACAMGYILKFMDFMGLEIEACVYEEVLPVIRKLDVDIPPPSSPVATDAEVNVDTFASRLSLLALLPAVMQFEFYAMWGVPSQWPAIGAYLQRQLGHDFRVLACVNSRPARRAIAAILVKELGPHANFSRRLKYLMAVIYATKCACAPLYTAFSALAAREGANQAAIEAVRSFAAKQIPEDAALVAGPEAMLPGAEIAPGTEFCGLVLAKVGSEMPASARMSGFLIQQAKEHLTSPEIVELCSWVGVLALLQRVYAWYEPEEGVLV